jgi:hypothetical protein
LDEIRADDQKSRAAVADDLSDLRRCEAEIDRRQGDARLACAEQKSKEVIAVLREIGDPLLRRDSRTDQLIGDAGGEGVDLHEGRCAALELESDGVRTPSGLHARDVRDRRHAIQVDHPVSPRAGATSRVGVDDDRGGASAFVHLCRFCRNRQSRLERACASSFHFVAA